MTSPTIAERCRRTLASVSRHRLAGFVVALPLMIIGLLGSEVVTRNPQAASMGSSLLLKALFVMIVLSNDYAARMVQRLTRHSLA